MPAYQQENHDIRVETPLGKDVLVLLQIKGSEEFSGLFRYELELLSQEPSIAAKDIVGKTVTVTLDYPDGSLRYYHAHVVKFSNQGTMDRGTIYKAEIVPWLWVLTKTTDCRIFQNKTVPQIIKQIFDDLGFTDYEMKLNGTHKPWEYCVQYNESDFDFVQRLMALEGIFSYFRHEQSKHTLVLGDHKGAYMDAMGIDKKIAYITEKAGDVLNGVVTSWEHNYEFRTGKWMLADYNFKKPNNSTNPTVDILKAKTNSVVELDGIAKYEQYEYCGEFEEKDEAEALVKLRMEQEEAGFDIVKGTSICRSFGPGVKFTVEKHRNKSEVGKQYVVTSVSHEARVGSYFVGGEQGDNFYKNEFTCIPAETAYRPNPKPPKPKMSGPLTAVVTGPRGEEIYCDEYGRVKVQFPWDREGKMDENSSCWIRCSQPAAGRDFGFMWIPRIGQEVVVEFEAGDPDRPIIIGSVYNPGQMPNRKLPDDKTKWGFKGNSSPGGAGHNELTIEDKKGKEQVYIHGEKDVDVRCKNNYHQIVGYEKSDGSYRMLVYKDRESIVKGDQSEIVNGTVKTKIDGDNHLIVGGDDKTKVGGVKHLDVGGDLVVKAGLEICAEAGTEIHQKAGMKYAAEAGMEMHLKGGMNVVVEAGLMLTLKAAGGFITIGPAGVAIQGTMVLINSGGAAGSGAGCSPKAPEAPEEAKPTEPKMDGYSQTGSKSCPS